MSLSTFPPYLYSRIAGYLVWSYCILLKVPFINYFRLLRHQIRFPLDDQPARTVWTTVFYRIILTSYCCKPAVSALFALPPYFSRRSRCQRFKLNTSFSILLKIIFFNKDAIFTVTVFPQSHLHRHLESLCPDGDI